MPEPEVDPRLEEEKTFENDLEQGIENNEVREKMEEIPKRKSRFVYISAIVIGSIFALYAILGLATYSFQDKIIYQPYSFNTKQLPLEEPYYGNWGYKITDESEFHSRKKGWRVVELNTGEGVTLHNYWMQSGRSDSVPTTFLYFHGNGDRIDNSIRFFESLRFGNDDYNCNVFLLSYRGYGLSTGKPSEKGIKIDAQAALDWIVRNVTEEEKKRIVVFGQSLGGAVAIDLVSKNNDKVGALIVENTFLSIPKLASDLSSLLIPFKSTIHQVFDSETAIQKIAVPILFISGAKDELIPPAHMQKLYEVAKSTRKELIVYPEGGHNNTSDSVGYFWDIVTYLNNLFGNQ